MKNIVKKIFLSYIFVFVNIAVADEGNIVYRKSFNETALSAHAFWRESSLTHNEYCNHSNLRDNGYTFSGKSFYTAYFLPSSVEKRYISPVAVDYSSIYQPWSWCFIDPESSYMNFRYGDSNGLGYNSDEGFIFMESIATYTNETRGPRVEAIINYSGEGGNFLAALYYLKEDGNLEKIKQITLSNSQSGDGLSIVINGMLPYPTLAYLKIWPENSGTSDFRVSNIRFFTEDCKPDLVNPGRCL